MSRPQFTAKNLFFPRQVNPNKEGGWVINFEFLRSVRADCSAEWRTSEEAVEAVLLAVERLMPRKRADGYAALRNAQARRVMPLIGPLLDAMDGVPNDTWDNMEVEAHALCSCLAKIRQAVEAEGEEYK